MADNSSEGNLLTGDKFTALFDCGMAFCADDTIKNVKNALNGRSLDYLFITHTHYDHIGALPFFREEFPGLKLVTNETGAAVLLKDTPRRVIRELSLEAAKSKNAPSDAIYKYDSGAFRADIIIKDGDIIDLGGVGVKSVETPGHTRDSISYFVAEYGLLILSETPGVLLPDGVIYPCYLTSYINTLDSIKKCAALDYKYLSLPHRGIADAEDTEGFFEKSEKSNRDCRDFILGMRKNSPEISDGDMLDLFFEKYASGIILQYQPKEAFLANARAAISCTLKEEV